MYTNEFKQSAIRKLELRGSRPVSEIARSLGVSVQILNYWRKRASLGSMTKKKSPTKLTMAEKLELLLKTASMSENELGEYLRGAGLHTADLERLKTEILSQLRGPSRAERSVENKHRLDKARLEKQLLRKDRALAETVALLVLKKKADSIFGTVDEGDEE